MKYVVVLIVLLLTGCNLTENSPAADDLYTVVRIIDGDTIDVNQGEVTYRVRYIGVNTPESDEACYSEATQANRTLIEGKRVSLERDESNTDRYGRLLRYVYVDGVFVNEALVRDGYAEAVLYEPDDNHYQRFHQLEIEAGNAGRGCHPTGIFDDGSDVR